MGILKTGVILNYIICFSLKNLSKQKISYPKNSVKKELVDFKFVCEKINNTSTLLLRDVVLLLSINYTLLMFQNKYHI